MNDNKKALLNLVKAESAEEIFNLLKNDSFFKRLSAKNWRPLGNDPTNITTAGNQQEDPINALVEKPINSIDHLLLKEAKLRGIDPEGSAAPKSMREAVETFLNIPDGDISKIDDKTRRKLAENVRVIASGSNKTPSIAVADSAEGQHPSDFSKSLLSLPRGKSNKNKIHFVQGRFNQGATGALWFCGGDKFQLVLSRKEPKLLSDNQKDEWGFTLIRKRPYSEVSDDEKMTWYEYFTDGDGNIFSFPGEDLPILPNDEKMKSGAYIKMYSYDLGKYSASDVTLELWRDLNRKLYSPALPIMIHETRKYGGHSPSKILVGNKYRTIKDENEKVKERIVFDSNLGKLGVRKIDVTVFVDRDSKGKPFRGVKSEFTTTDEALFLTMNGQTHKTEPRSFFRRKEFGTSLDFLADYLMVHVDLTDIPRDIRDELVMTSRDRFRKGDIYNQAIERITSDLRENNILRRLNTEYKTHFLADIQPDKGEVKKIVSKILKKNRSLAKWLNLGEGITLPPLEPTNPTTFEPENPPTKFSLKVPEGVVPPYTKDFPINYKYVWLQFITNAPNNYLETEMGGKIRISLQNIEHSEYLDHGVLWLKIYKERNQKLNDEKELVISLERQGLEPLTEKVTLRYIEEREQISETPPPNGFDFVPPSIRIKEGESKNATLKAVIPGKLKDGVIVNLKSSSSFLELSTDKIILNSKKAVDGIVSRHISIKGKKKNIKGTITAFVNGTDLKAELEIEVIPESMGDERNLPEIKGLSKEEWGQLAGSDWKEDNIAEVKGDIILVNMDAAPFHDYISQNPKITKEARKNIEEFYKLGIGLNALVLDLELKESPNGNKPENFMPAMKAIARVILPINSYGRGLVTSPEDI